MSANAKRLSDRQVIVLTMIGNAADAARGSRHSTDWMRAGITSLLLMNYFNFDYFSDADRLLAGLERRELIRKADTCEVWSLTEEGYLAYTRVSAKGQKLDEARQQSQYGKVEEGVKR